MPSSEPTRVLFVCLGNICRSPLAESLFRHMTRERGVEHLFEVDSAGTSGYHEGDPPDSRSVATARARGVEVTGASRPLTAADLRSFDWVIAMDAQNEAEIERLRRRAGGNARVHRLREWDPEADSLDVPDPYYSGPSGFEHVHDVVERSCERLLDELLAERADR
jgi:protein-tyrosine phosphatase